MTRDVLHDGLDELRDHGCLISHLRKARNLRSRFNVSPVNHYLLLRPL
jgi:hypothetical protein